MTMLDGEKRRAPDITLNVWFSPAGIQAEVTEHTGKPTRTIVRDFTWDYDDTKDLVVMMRSWMYALVNLFVRAL